MTFGYKLLTIHTHTHTHTPWRETYSVPQNIGNYMLRDFLWALNPTLQQFSVFNWSYLLTAENILLKIPEIFVEYFGVQRIRTLIVTSCHSYIIYSLK